MNIFIYGVPGSGKTTLAKSLSRQLGFKFYEIDLTRKQAQRGKTIEKNPFYFLPTTEAYKALGRRTQKNVITGMLNVRKTYKKYINQKISESNDKIIFESAFLDPEELKRRGMVILLTIPSEIKHKKRFLVHRTKESLTNGQFENARIIQDFFITEAKKLDIKIFKNTGNINNLEKNLLIYILNLCQK